MPERLGQHWLNDKTTLTAVAEAAGLTKADTALEIGPGRGSLTAVLLKRSARVVAVEVDPKLAAHLTKSFPGASLNVINGDILHFDLNWLPQEYKVAANLPYYITAPILQHLIYSRNPPSQMGLLVQKEIAERLSASAGDLSILAVSVQNRYDVTAGAIVKAELFSPPPKVDSQIISLVRLSEPQLGPDDNKVLKLVKIGFSQRRKTLLNVLSGVSLATKQELPLLLSKINLTEKTRAQELRLEQWRELYKELYK